MIEVFIFILCSISLGYLVVRCTLPGGVWISLSEFTSVDWLAITVAHVLAVGAAVGKQAYACRTPSFVGTMRWLILMPYPKLFHDFWYDHDAFMRIGLSACECCGDAWREMPCVWCYRHVCTRCAVVLQARIQARCQAYGVTGTYARNGFHCRCYIDATRRVFAAAKRAVRAWVELVGGDLCPYGSEGPSPRDLVRDSRQCPQCRPHELCGVSVMLCSLTYDIRRCWCMRCDPPQLPRPDEEVADPVRVRKRTIDCDDQWREPPDVDMEINRIGSRMYVDRLTHIGPPPAKAQPVNRGLYAALPALHEGLAVEGPGLEAWRAFFDNHEFSQAVPVTAYPMSMSHDISRWPMFPMYPRGNDAHRDRPMPPPRTHDIDPWAAMNRAFDPTAYVSTTANASDAPSQKAAGPRADAVPFKAAPVQASLQGEAPSAAKTPAAAFKKAPPQGMQGQAKQQSGVQSPILMRDVNAWLRSVRDELGSEGAAVPEDDEMRLHPANITAIDMLRDREARRLLRLLGVPNVDDAVDQALEAGTEAARAIRESEVAGQPLQPPSASTGVPQGVRDIAAQVVSGRVTVNHALVEVAEIVFDGYLPQGSRELVEEVDLEGILRASMIIEARGPQPANADATGAAPVQAQVLGIYTHMGHDMPTEHGHVNWSDADNATYAAYRVHRAEQFAAGFLHYASSSDTESWETGSTPPVNVTRPVTPERTRPLTPSVVRCPYCRAAMRSDPNTRVIDDSKRQWVTEADHIQPGFEYLEHLRVCRHPPPWPGRVKPPIAYVVVNFKAPPVNRRPAPKAGYLGPIGGCELSHRAIGGGVDGFATITDGWGDFVRVPRPTALWGALRDAIDLRPDSYACAAQSGPSATAPLLPTSDAAGGRFASQVTSGTGSLSSLQEPSGLAEAGSRDDDDDAADASLPQTGPTDDDADASMPRTGPTGQTSDDWRTDEADLQAIADVHGSQAAAEAADALWGYATADEDGDDGRGAEDFYDDFEPMHHEPVTTLDELPVQWDSELGEVESALFEHWEAMSRNEAERYGDES